MSLDLNERQRAMLAEMDVHVWWPGVPVDAAAPDDSHVHLGSMPESAIESVVIAACPVSTIALNLTHAPSLELSAIQVEDAARSRGRPPSKVSATAIATTPAELHPLPEGIATMDWSALRVAMSRCQACVMCLGRRAPVLNAPADAALADWFVMGEPPDESQERAGQPFVEEVGQLLDNMLSAVGVKRFDPAVTEAGQSGDAASSAYLSLVLKCRPALPTAPNAQAMAACVAYLRREIVLVQPKVILAMGRLAMQVLLSEDHPDGMKLPLGKLRGHVWHFQGVPVVVTYPPAYLLRNGADKAKAWMDLCLAADVAQGKLPAPV
jgi:DNA polymerase